MHKKQFLNPITAHSPFSGAFWNNVVRTSHQRTRHWSTHSPILFMRSFSSQKFFFNQVAHLPDFVHYTGNCSTDLLSYLRNVFPYFVLQPEHLISAPRARVQEAWPLLHLAPKSTQLMCTTQQKLLTLTNYEQRSVRAIKFLCFDCVAVNCNECLFTS